MFITHKNHKLWKLDLARYLDYEMGNSLVKLLSLYKSTHKFKKESSSKMATFIKFFANINQHPYNTFVLCSTNKCCIFYFSALITSIVTVVNFLQCFKTVSFACFLIVLTWYCITCCLNKLFNWNLVLLCLLLIVVYWWSLKKIGQFVLKL